MLDCHGGKNNKMWICCTCIFWGQPIPIGSACLSFHTIKMRNWFLETIDPESWKDINTMNIDSIKQDQHDQVDLRWLVSSRARCNHGGTMVGMFSPSGFGSRVCAEDGERCFWTQQSCSWVDHPITQELNGFFPGIHRIACDHMMFGSRPLSVGSMLNLGLANVQIQS